MRKVFIADAHLRNSHDDNYSKLLSFLRTLPGNTDTIFILGDLFEFWVGYRVVPFRHYLPLLDELRNLRRAGIEIVYFEGNHDFHMGPFFEETLGAEIHPGPATVSIDGRQAFMCHGDEINRKDYSYRLLRCLFHSRLTKRLIPVIPPSVASWIAESLGRKSRASHSSNRSRWDFTSLVREFAAARFSAGCDIVVTGHFHLPLLEVSQPGNKILLSLGDWLTHYTYGEWEEGKLSLKKFDQSRENSLR